MQSAKVKDCKTARLQDKRLQDKRQKSQDKREKKGLFPQLLDNGIEDICIFFKLLSLYFCLLSCLQIKLFPCPRARSCHVSHMSILLITS